jgi:hypothetical protein
MIKYIYSYSTKATHPRTPATAVGTSTAPAAAINTGKPGAVDMDDVVPTLVVPVGLSLAVGKGTCGGAILLSSIAVAPLSGRTTVSVSLDGWGAIQVLSSMTPVTLVIGSVGADMKELSSTLPLTLRRLEEI